MTLASCSTHQIIIMKEHFKLLPQDASAMFTHAAIKRQNCLVYQNPVGILPKNLRFNPYKLSKKSPRGPPERTPKKT